MALVAVVLLIFGAGFAALVLVGTAVESTTTSGGEIEAVEVPAAGPVEAPAEAPAPEPGSLIEHRRFTAAMRTLRAKPREKLVSLRVAADRIDAQLKTPDGKLRIVQVGPNGKLHQLTVTGGGFASITTLPFESVNTRAPERLAKAAADELGRPVSRVDYLVVLDFNGETIWSVFFKDGKHFQGDAAGRLPGHAP
jgi:hypothetical protein